MMMITPPSYRTLAMYSMWLAMMFSLFFGSYVYAGELKDLMMTNSKQLLDKIQVNRELYEGDKKRLNEIVRQQIKPYFQFEYMARFAAGRHWRRMNDLQKERYRELFIQLLVNTYATAILEYQFEDLSFQEEFPGRKKNRFILTMFAKKYNDKVRIDYEIAITKKGPVVINIKLEGISLLINYRKSFGEILAKGGPNKLIDFLEKTMQNSEINE